MQIIMKAVAFLAVVFAASAASLGDLSGVPLTDIQGLEGVTEGLLLGFTPSDSDPFSLSPDGDVVLNGECTLTVADGVTLPSGVSLPSPGSCSLPVQGFETTKTKNGKGGKGRELISRELATCDIVNVLLGVININILGLIVSLPQGLKLDVLADPTGGLLGGLLCGLLAGGGLLSILNLNLLQSVVDALNNLFG